MASARSKACAISTKVRDMVYVRDGYRCIYCGKRYNLQIAHYIPRSQGGLGVPENLGTLCVDCHTALDNGADSNLREEIKSCFTAHLEQYYDLSTAKRVYSRWG